MDIQKTYLKLTFLLIASAAFVGAFATALSWLVRSVGEDPEHRGTLQVMIAVVAILGVAIYVGLRRYFTRMDFQGRVERAIDGSSTALEAWTTSLTPAPLRNSIIITGALSLFLELVLIRWQASLFPVFALYKNFTMLACFCGLGIGYALASRKPLLLAAALPLLTLTLVLLTVLRYAPGPRVLDFLSVVPVYEENSVLGIQLNESMSLGSRFLLTVPVYMLLIATFLLNVLTMLPIGQFCGRLMDQHEKPLVSYGCNLAGSIAGVVVVFFFSWLWAGPVIWFGLSAMVLLAYGYQSPALRNFGIAVSAICITTVAWPAQPLVQNIYSPYQLIQKVSKPDGLMQILASGAYYQKVYNLAVPEASLDDKPALKKIAGYYNLPFKAAPSLEAVAIVGAGSGNDVAAAVRNGAKHVDAVEIDPAIRNLGILNHPEHPYEDPRVTSIINDARTFFRNGTSSYDAIVYGVLDSHALLSHGSNVRLDSFVYTSEGIREAYVHLRPGGQLSLAFALTSHLMGEKIFRILKGLPEAGAPVAVLTGYDSSITTTFLVRKGAEVELPKEYMKAYDLTDVTQSYLDQPADKKLDLPSDDWPFFYMDVKAYPASYVVSLGLILLLSIGLIRAFLQGQSMRVAMLPFFFLGAGFMLVETKAITELGLLFGNTWQVVAVTITSVLTMAFMSNVIAQKLKSVSLPIVFVFLLTVLVAGYVIATRGGIGHADLLAKLMMVVLLTCPMLFSGIAFSTLLKRADDLASAMAYNLMGAMLGGLLEYNSMQFGFAFLYLIAVGFYALAWATCGSLRLRTAATA